MKTLLSILGGIMLLMAATIGWQFGQIQEQTFIGSSDPEKTSDYVEYAYNVIGTKVGTSTTPVNFYSVATTSSVIKTNSQWESMVFTVNAVRASSTGSYVNLQFFGSNDYLCDTATTSPDYGNPVLTSDINWSDIGYNIRELAGSLSPSSATSTWGWIPTFNKNSRAVVLEDINFECIKTIVGSNKTSLLIQARGR